MTEAVTSSKVSNELLCLSGRENFVLPSMVRVEEYCAVLILDFFGLDEEPGSNRVPFAHGCRTLNIHSRIKPLASNRASSN